MSTTIYDTLEIYRSYPERSPFDLNPPIYNLVPKCRFAARNDTPQLRQAVREIAQRTGVNMLCMSNGAYPFLIGDHDLRRMQKEAGLFTEYRVPPPLTQTSLPDDVEFIERINPEGHTMMFTIRIAGNLRLLKIYPDGEVSASYRSSGAAPDPRDLFKREKDAYAHLLHYGVCDKGVVPRCYGWTTLSHAHLNSMICADPMLADEDVDVVDDIRQQMERRRFPHAIVLEYFPGAEPVTTTNITYNIAEAALRSLCVVHAAYVLHGDIRGNNILLLPDGRVVWADFNASMTASDPALTRFELFSELEEGWDRFYIEMLPDNRVGL